MQPIRRFVAGALLLPIQLISATVGALAEAAPPRAHQTTVATRLSDRELSTRLASYLDRAAAEGFTGAVIVERVSGRPYEEFLREKLFLPAAMKDTGYSLPGWDPSRLAHGTSNDGGDWGTIVEHAIADGGPGWHLLGNGGIHSTVDDMAHWHRALIGNEILSDASKRKMYAHHADEGGGTWYGYGWSLEPTPWGELITHNGGNPFFFADFLRFPDSDVVIYYTTSSRDRRMHRLARPLARIVFTGEIPELEPEAAPLAPPGSGEPAAAGSAAARWGLPGTAAGAGAGVLLDALAASDPTARTAFAAAGFSASVVADKGVERLVRLLERMRGDLGRFTVLGFAAEPDGLMVALRPQGGPGPMKISLQVEAEPPHRITGIGVQLGD